MIRILLAVHKFFPKHRAGTEVLTLKVAQELLQRGYEVLVVAGNPPDVDARHAAGERTSDYIHDGVPVHVVEEPLRLEGYTFKHEFWHEGIARHFESIVDRFKPDLVHVFHAQNLSASMIEVAARKSIPAVFSAMDFWFVCPVVQLKRPNGAICRGPSAGAANCLTCYTPQLFPPVEQFAEAVERKYSACSKLLSALPGVVRNISMRALYGTYISGKVPAAVQATVERPKVLRNAANQFQKIMVPTKIMRDIFIENGIREDLIQHVPFGIDTAPLLPFQNKKPSDTLRFGFIGTFFEHKGVDLLIEAFGKLPGSARASLTLYGDLEQFPDYGRYLEKCAGRAGVNTPKIRFAGTFPNAELGEVMTELDVLVVPSRWYENTPLVIQSALATKTPVIATNLGGMSELVKHDVNGLLFDLNDAGSLCDQLLRLLNEPSLLPRLKTGIVPERTVSQMVDDIESVYRSVGVGSYSSPNESTDRSAFELHGTILR